MRDFKIQFFSFFSSRCVRARRAFTLVEAMLALTVSALVMFGCVALMFDMMKISEYFERGDSFANEVDGVEKFLRNAFVESKFKNTNSFPNSISSNTAKTVFVARDFESPNSSEYFLAYGVAEEHPFYSAPFGFGSYKLCLLKPEKDGLFVQWRCLSAEMENSEAGIYIESLSSLVKKVGYIYSDDKGWEEEFELRSTSEMPAFIKLYFEKNGESATRIIPLNTVLDFQISK